MYKIFKGLDKVNKDTLLPMAAHVYTGTHNQELKLRRTRRYSRTDIRKRIFTNRTVEVWNKLPAKMSIVYHK